MPSGTIKFHEVLSINLLIYVQFVTAKTDSKRKHFGNVSGALRWIWLAELGARAVFARLNRMPCFGRDGLIMSREFS